MGNIVASVASGDVEARLPLALLLRRSGDNEASRAELEQVVARYPQGVPGRFALGILRYQAKEWEGAEAPLRAVVYARPVLGEVRYLLGLVSQEPGKLRPAARHLSVVLVVLGPSREILGRLGEIQPALDADPEGP